MNVRAYTVALFLAGLLAAVTFFSHQMMIDMLAGDKSIHVIKPVLRFAQAYEVVLCICCLTAGVARAKRSPLGPAITPAVSILLVAWFPIGTAFFVWWLTKIRRREGVVDVCPECGTALAPTAREATESS